MLDKLYIVVHKLNQLLILIMDHSVRLLQKFTPKPIADRFNSVRAKLKAKQDLVQSKVDAIKDKVRKRGEETYQTLRSFQYKEKIDETKGKFQSFGQRAMTKAFWIALLGTLASQSKLFLAKVKTIKVKYLAAGGGASALSILGVYYILVTGNKIAEETDRSPASIKKKKYGVRPEYYKGEQKQTTVSEITMPVYFHLKGSSHRVLFDLNLKVSNRALVQFLEKHEYELKDHINSNVEPFPPDFPLTSEGKEIIKIKVLEEVNNFIKLKKVEGKLEEVYIDHIISG